MNDLRAIRDGARVLLINPPVADTVEVEQQDMLTAVQPFGLLRLATWFRRRGCHVELIDCVRDPALGSARRRHVRATLECGNFAAEQIAKPIYHYGLDHDLLAARLQACARPDFIAITSIFTWHLGVYADLVRTCKEVFPETPVGLGGNVAALCPDEARATGADLVYGGAPEGSTFLPTAIDLLEDRSIDFLQLVRGCPHHCSYCVTNELNAGRVVARPPEEVFGELQAKLAAYGTRCFIFFDDFILYQQPRYLDPFLDLVAQAKPGVELEFALGLSAYLVTDALAARLRAARVERVTIALETINPDRSAAMGRPQHIEELLRAVAILRHHGYRGRNLRAFYLIGLPGQTTDEILRAILFLFDHGIAPSLTAYTLTPRSGDWARYGHLVAGRRLEELGPCLWRFAHAGMQVRQLDAIYRYFHERFFPLERIRAAQTEDPVIGEMQRLLAAGRHQPGSW